jgi:hypothetical protein
MNIIYHEIKKIEEGLVEKFSLQIFIPVDV